MLRLRLRRRRRLDHLPSRFDPVEWQKLLDSVGGPEALWRLRIADPPARESQDESVSSPLESDAERDAEASASPDFFQKLGDVLREVGGLIAELERERAGGERAAQWEDALARSLAGTFERDISLADLHELRETVLAFTADPNRLSSLRAIALAADRIALVVDEAIRVRLLIESRAANSQEITTDDPSALAS